MGSSDDEDDYIFFGTSLQEEEESRAGQRRKDVKDPALTKQLPLHKQEVTDAEGRRRFHGAFTGGYSAGYYNTVGSLEGWAPSTFKSSREDRASSRSQLVADFLDEDELEEMRKSGLQVRAEYDTFGSIAAEKARQAAHTEASSSRERGHITFVPDAIITPVADSIGIRLLQSMGWRQGKGVGPVAAPDKPSKGGRRWGPEAGVGPENTPIYDLAPKTDQHGLGFDPFKGAEDFRNVKRQRAGGRDKVAEQAAARKRARGIAFGTGAAEETDTYGYMEDYVTADDSRDAGGNFSFEIASDEEDTDVLVARGGKLDPQFMLPGKATPLSILAAGQAPQKDIIPGFVRGAETVAPKSYPPPKIPAGYQPHHTFPEVLQPAGTASKDSERPAREVPPPTDQELRKTIEAMAPFVARNGPAFEAVAVKENARSHKFEFLFGGAGAEYYRWRVQVAKAELKAAGACVSQRPAPLAADDRGALLGETQLAATAAAAAASAASAPAQPAAALHPNLSGIAESDRKRLQDTLAGSFASAKEQDMGFGGRPVGLHRPAPGLASGQASGQADAHLPGSAAAAFLGSIGGRFASGGTFEPEAAGGLQAGVSTVKSGEAEQAAPKRPQRSVQEWRPEPLLCKRFNVPDPFKGRAAAPSEGASHFKSDRLQLPDTLAAAARPPPEAALQLPGPPPIPPQGLPPQQFPGPPSLAPVAADSRALADAFLESLGAEDSTAGVPKEDNSSALPLPPGLPPPPGLTADAASAAPTFIEKPIDLFKAIFEAEDSSDEEEEADADKQQQQQQQLQPSHTDIAEQRQIKATPAPQRLAPGQQPDELALARQAALAARAAPQPSRPADGLPAAPSAPQKDAAAARAEPPAAAAVGPTQNGLAEALERAQQLAGERVRERQRAEQEQGRRGASSAVQPSAERVDAIDPAGQRADGSNGMLSEEQRQAIERVLKTHKHAKKKKTKHEKGKRKKEKGKEKDRKEKKNKKSSNKDGKRKSSRKREQDSCSDTDDSEDELDVSD